MNPIIIWDLPHPPPEPKKNTGQFIFWRSFETQGFPRAISLPRLVEKNALTLREKYLAWVYQAGQAKFQKKKLVDYFEIYPGFSYWWMTYLVEKCNYDRSIYIEDIIRLLALVSWIKKNRVREARLFTGNPKLADCFQKWCLNQEIGLSINLYPPKNCVIENAKEIILKQIQLVWGASWLIKKYIRGRTIRNLGVREWINAPKGITFASYFFNYDIKKAARGNFQSHFWGPLPNVLKKRKVFSRWIHLWGPFDETAQFKKIAFLIKKTNEKQKNSQVITILESFFDKKILIQSLKDYIIIAWKSWKISYSKLMPKLDGLEIWPFFANQWQNCSSGSTAINNLCSFHLFQKAFKNEKKSGPLVYLMENQPWELGMIQAWRKHLKGAVIGFPHSTVRFWDLRYFFDKRNNLHKLKSSALPKPDLIAVHSKSMHKTFLGSNYESKSLINVEALRFGKSKKTDLRIITKYEKQLKENTRKQLAVFTDFSWGFTDFQLNLLNQVSENTLDQFLIFLKPHPAFKIEIKKYPNLKIQNEKLSTGQLLSQCDLVFTSNSTSVAFEAYSLGIPVITAVDPERFNYSPFFNQDKVTFVRSPKDLDRALKKAAFKRRSLTKRKANLVDSKVPLWIRLLSKKLK